VLFCLRTESQFVDVVDDLAQVVTALDLVLDLAEDFANLVFDSVRRAGPLLETVQIGKELAIYEFGKIWPILRFIVVYLAVLALGRGPFRPAVRLVEDETLLLLFQSSLIGFVLLQPVQIFQEEEPRGLLGIVQLARTARFFPEDVVDVFEGLLEH